ncbi:MAG: hypothetical protein MPW17_10950 [Candidatus Manganitrophus sp.]|nr:hypothetical protein [Candidatus Manganitrophus sp.]WDT69308.1 MAG: hypothetical protein MPW17_10950 [Candidatus Manganitrophus sp.]
MTEEVRNAPLRNSDGFKQFLLLRSVHRVIDIDAVCNLNESEPRRRKKLGTPEGAAAGECNDENQEKDSSHLPFITQGWPATERRTRQAGSVLHELTLPLFSSSSSSEKLGQGRRLLSDHEHN